MTTSPSQSAARLLFAALVPAVALYFAPQSTGQSSKTPATHVSRSEPGQGVNFYSLDRESALGLELAQQVRRSAKILDDTLSTDYVNRVAQKLAQVSDARFPLTVALIASDAPSSLILPGGFLFINTGSVTQSTGEAGLAAVLAHGIAHVALRSATKMATKEEILTIPDLVTSIFTDDVFQWNSAPTANDLRFALPLQFLKVHRDAQLAADHLGVEYLYKAGYAPEEYVRMLQRTQNFFPVVSKKQLVFSRDPPLDQRIRLIRKVISNSLPPKDGAILSTAEFDTVAEHLCQIAHQ